MGVLERRIEDRPVCAQGAVRARLMPMADRELARLRQITLALPEVNERLSHGAPSFYFRDKRPICYFHDADFANDDRVSLWCPAAAGIQENLVGAEPERFFAPTPSASGVFRDWIGVYLDTSETPSGIGTRSPPSSGTPTAWWHQRSSLTDSRTIEQAMRASPDLPHPVSPDQGHP
jgi:hypothetical protein